MVEDAIRSVCDTARWVAYHRATESDREDALFRDPYARQLAGDRGRLISVLMDAGGYVALRTALFDQVIGTLVKSKNLKTVVNLAAGFDTRPHRLALPADLDWIEVDLPEIVALKDEELRVAPANCRVTRLVADLSETRMRREVFSQIGRNSDPSCVMSEGLLIYLDENEVSALADDLHAQTAFEYWVVEVQSPQNVAGMQRDWGMRLASGNAAVKFAPPDWRDFYARHKWSPVAFYDLHTLAVRQNRIVRSPGAVAALRRFAGSVRRQAFGDLPGSAGKSGVAVLRRA